MVHQENCSYQVAAKKTKIAASILPLLTFDSGWLILASSSCEVANIPLKATLVFAVVRLVLRHLHHLSFFVAVL